MVESRNEELKPVYRKNRNGGELFEKKQQLDPSIAPIVAEFDKLFNEFNKRFFKSTLSKPVITLSLKGSKSGKSHCTDKKVWADTKTNRYFEINISPEYLSQPVEVICEVLLHEMVHLFNRLNSVKDCTSNGQYHNKVFRNSAEQHGLHAEQVSKYGYKKTSLKPETLEFIKSLDLSAFNLYRDAAVKFKTTAEESKKPSSTRIYFCPKCKTLIRATKEVRVRCDVCNRLFQKRPETM